MSDTRLTVMEAIARKRTVAARYNGASIKLAPHLLFTRHGDLFIRALNMSKPWRADSEQRLGQFKLAGLMEAEVLDESFEQLPAYEAVPPRESDTMIMTI